jgi:ribosomal protein RSM22 (predicted rRNA methylase)
VEIFQSKPDASCAAALDRLPGVIDKVFPLPRRFRQGLPADVAELSRLFTFGREDRSASYLGRPNLLSAYLRYFLPWNVYRLCRLLPSLPLDLKNGDAVVDLGSGPLTLVLALWISRPELRPLNLEFRCVDKTPSILDAGKKIFSSLSADAGGWYIKTIRGELRRNGKLSTTIQGKRAALVSALNLFNEIFWDFSPVDREGLNALALQGVHLLSSLGDGKFLTVEPGIPRSGEFISSLRAAFLEQGFSVLSPCIHGETCPFPGGQAAGRGKEKWCHFSFDTLGAPPELKKLSAAAGIPKERAVMSFLLAGQKVLPESVAAGGVTKDMTIKARIISDAFPVGGGYGRYGCSARGAVLALCSRESIKIEALCSGSLVELELTGQRDSKSGALTGKLP